MCQEGQPLPQGVQAQKRHGLLGHQAPTCSAGRPLLLLCCRQHQAEGSSSPAEEDTGDRHTSSVKMIYAVPPCGMSEF